MLGRRRRRRTNTRPTLVKYLVFDGLHILAPKLVHRSAITVVRDCTEEGLLTKSGPGRVLLNIDNFIIFSLFVFTHW